MLTRQHRLSWQRNARDDERVPPVRKAQNIHRGARRLYAASPASSFNTLPLAVLRITGRILF